MTRPVASIGRRRARHALIAGALVSTAALAGCGSYDSDFLVAVGNRTTFPITVFADGIALGGVGAGQTGTFTLTLRPTGETTRTPQGNLVSPSAVADVTFAARESSTGTLSPAQTVTVVQHYKSYVEFKPLCSRSSNDEAPDPSKRWACPESPPTAAFVFSPTNPASGGVVSFNASASRAATFRTIVRYVWDFGDPAKPAPASGVTTVHTYDTPGSYTVTLTVVDDAGEQGTTSHVVTVTPR